MNTTMQVVDEISKVEKSDPDYLLKVAAIVKRHIHCEKAMLCMRLSHYSRFSRGHAKGRRQKNKEILSGLRFMQETLEDKFETHEAYAVLPDTQVITWDVGRHKYEKGELVLKESQG